MKPIRLFGRDLSVGKHHQFGTHRVRSPEDTLRAYMPLAPKMGITRLANITGLDSIGLPVYTSIRPNARTLSTSQGKGVDAASAKASALMEAIELYHEERATYPLRWDSYTSLRRTDHVVDITALTIAFDRVLHVDTRRLWLQGYDLMQGRPIWVPFEIVCGDNLAQGGLDPCPWVQSSIGLASGNHLLEATAHALFEVIEHDCAALNRHRQPVRLDLSTVDDPACRHVLSLLEAAAIEVAVWDMTSDLGIPAYSCMVLDRPDRPEWRKLGGYGGDGCHAAPEIALLRCLTEAVQSRLTHIAGSRDDMFRGGYDRAENEEVRRAQWEMLREPCEMRRFDPRDTLSTGTFEGDIAAVMDILRQAQVSSIAVVDLTIAELGIPVVKVLVPGLEGDEGARPGERASRLIGAQS